MLSLFVDKGSQSDFLHGLLGLKCCPFFFPHHADLSSSRMIPQQHLRPYQPPTEKISAKRQSGLNKKGRFQSFGEERIRHGTGLHSVAVLVAQNNKHRSNDAYTYFATRRLTFFFFFRSSCLHPWSIASDWQATRPVHAGTSSQLGYIPTHTCTLLRKRSTEDGWKSHKVHIQDMQMLTFLWNSPAATGNNWCVTNNPSVFAVLNFNCRLLTSLFGLYLWCMIKTLTRCLDLPVLL